VCTSTGSAANAMDIVFRVVRIVIVENVSDVTYVLGEYVSNRESTGARANHPLDDRVIRIGSPLSAFALCQLLPGGLRSDPSSRRSFDCGLEQAYNRPGISTEAVCVSGEKYGLIHSASVHGRSKNRYAASPGEVVSSIMQSNKATVKTTFRSRIRGKCP